MSGIVDKGGAVLSECGRYRYVLRRPGRLPHPGERRVVFVMLNPSTADDTEDDPTIRRCLGFARAWDCEHLTVVNLFAWRSTDPKVLARMAPSDSIGPHNDKQIMLATAGADLVIAAWGADAAAEERGRVVRRMLADRLHHLGLTKAGHPRHPLYLRGDTMPEPWR